MSRRSRPISRITRFAALAKSVSGVGYWWLDVPTGKITWSEEMFVTLMGGALWLGNDQQAAKPRVWSGGLDFVF